MREGGGFLEVGGGGGVGGHEVWTVERGEGRVGDRMGN